MYREASYEPHGFPQMNRISSAVGRVARILTVGEDALLHGEALLVVATSDAEDVSLPLISQMIGLDLSSHTLVIEESQLVIIDHLKCFLGSRRGERDV